MTAKEKAKQLVDMYSAWVECLTPVGEGYIVDTNLYRYNAKQAALACVDEVKKEINTIGGSVWKDAKDRTRSFTYEAKVRLKSKIDYWNEVKKEIQNL